MPFHKPRYIKKEVTTQRQKEAWELRQKMWSQARIAAHLGVSQPAVWELLNKAHTAYQKQYVESVARVKTEQVLRLEMLIDQTYQEWERSKEDIVIVRDKIQKRGSAKDNAGNIERVTEKRNRTGDPRYLLVILKAMEDIRKITGIESPARLTFDVNNNISLENALKELENNPAKVINTYQALMRKSGD